MSLGSLDNPQILENTEQHCFGVAKSVLWLLDYMYVYLVHFNFFPNVKPCKTTCKPVKQYGLYMFQRLSNKN